MLTRLLGSESTRRSLAKGVKARANCAAWGVKARAFRTACGKLWRPPLRRPPCRNRF